MTNSNIKWTLKKWGGWSQQLMVVCDLKQWINFSRIKWIVVNKLGFETVSVKHWSESIIVILIFTGSVFGEQGFLGGDWEIRILSGLLQPCHLIDCGGEPINASISQIVHMGRRCDMSDNREFKVYGSFIGVCYLWVVKSWKQHD